MEGFPEISLGFMPLGYQFQRDSYNYHLEDSIQLRQEAVFLWRARTRSALVQLDSIVFVSVSKTPLSVLLEAAGGSVNSH